MTDTQWPRFEVFHQETPERPHRHAGSVHAPDAEIALLNARDVFVRRPNCSSLWVAPESAISGGTAEQLAERPLTEEDQGPPAAFLVFAKLDPRGSLTHVGQVEARSRTEALRLALRDSGPRKPFVLWIVPRSAVTATEADQEGPLFGPARDKPYRDQAFYHIQTALRRLRREAGG